MRRRLLGSTLAVVLVAVVTLAVPLAVVTACQVRGRAYGQLRRDAATVAAVTAERLGDGGTVDPARLAALVPGRRVEIDTADGRRLAAGPPVSGRAVRVTVRMDEGRVTVLDSAHELDEGTVGAVLLVAALVGLASVVAVALALVQARRLAAPLVGLAQTADRLGRGQFDLPRGRLGLPEADHVAEVLADSAARVGELVRRQAQFASDAAHQLRTPLTAIGLRLEEMVAASDQEEVRAEGRLALAQADRLARVVTALLARTRDGTGELPRSVEASALLREQEQQWAPVYARAGRALVVDGADGTVWASPSHVGQAVGVLLDNALRHGGGTVRLAARDEGRRVRLSVSDEGSGIPDELVPRLFDRAVSGAERTGIGLALARALVEADRGHLELVRGRPPVFAVVLPAAPDHSLTGS